MTIKIVASNINPPLGGIAVTELIKESNPVAIEWGNETSITFTNQSKLVCQTNNDILRVLARDAPKYGLYGKTPSERTQVDHWLSFTLSFRADKDSNLAILNKSLGPITFLVANKLTIADLAVFNELYSSRNEILKTGKFPDHVQRWYDLLNVQPCIIEAIKQLPKDSKREGSVTVVAERKQEGKFVDLPGAEMGKVVVRFPPEASGFLHIGHAKAALLNQYYQQAFKGKFIMRFDDTNPAKENVEFEKVILEDVAMLEIKPDLYTYTSDYFELMLELCEKLLKEEKAYVDDTPPEKMKAERDERLESANRSNSVEKNLQMWKEMLKSSEAGQKCCVRAKIDMKSPNGCMRDPTIYRCKNEPHPRTGTKYKVYPTYDFACPIVDAIENVTHTLRTMEYHDRDDQFYWFIDALKLRKPVIWEYSRLNMTNTVLSKRKLTWFVEQGLVDGWDDPRFPTVRGILRRGMTVDGLRQFIIAQGSSKSVVFMEWDKIWAFNKKVIDPIAPRYTALEKQNTVVVNIAGAKKEVIQVPLHPKNNDVGTKHLHLGPQILIDYVDAEVLKEGENTTFINWGNMMINKVNKENGGRITSVDATLNLDNKDFKKTLKLTWLCKVEAEEYPPTFCVYFDHIINKAVLGKEEDFKSYIGHETRLEIPMLGDPELKNLKHGDIIQLQRRGFFKVDNAYAPASQQTGVESPIVLLFIPDGHQKETSATVTLNKKTASAPVTSANTVAADELNAKINKQGDIVRNLKSAKASKEDVDKAVKALLALKTDYKTATGKEWKPASANDSKVAATSVASSTVLSPVDVINGKIVSQGDIVRDLKSAKASKDKIDEAVKTLLALKAEYKTASGKDWKPPVAGAVTSSVAKPAGSTNDEEISKNIIAQGDIVRELKSAKASKDKVDEAVKGLLALKANFKSATGKDWKPPVNGASAVTSANTQSAVSSTADEINKKITSQGDTVRELKSAKAPKDKVDAAVKELLALKAEYKKATGKDWKAPVTGTVSAVSSVPVPAQAVSSAASEINDKIVKQGDTVRELKAAKAPKEKVDAVVKELLALKAEYKTKSGKDWTPPPAAPKTASVSVELVKSDISVQSTQASSNPVQVVLDKIKAQGDTIRNLKAKKADKAAITAEVEVLLKLKTQYKELTGKDWTLSSVAEMAPTNSAPAESEKDSLTQKITAQGNTVRELKTNKGAAKADVEAAVKQLLDLKAEYKKVTGTDFPTPGRNDGKGGSKPKAAEQPKPKPAPKSQSTPAGKDDGTGPKKQTRLCLEAKKEENLPDWYSQVITKGELIEYYDVSGCYILRHWSFAIWKTIRTWFDNEITNRGVKECYFPIFVSKAALEKEKDHIADFAPEVAWVTKSGDSDLAEPVAIRPTSETVMYPSYAKWIQSYRDLPLRLNQWNNVVRWEFKHPQPFLRTREFLWQEGHTAFASQKEATDEVYDILDLYARVYTDLLAIPVVKGRKTEKEKFAGGDFTTTVEAFISASGRAIQGATSHHLGQNFSKMFEIVYHDPETQEKCYAYQNSWGMTTRTIGVLIMVHADNQGLVLPPQVACIQTIIVPCGVTVTMKDDERKELQASCDELEKKLKEAKIRVEGDYRDNYSPGWKFNHWELKGVPIRIELGPKDLKAKQFVAVRRDTGEKMTIPRDQTVSAINSLLTNIQSSMYEKASADLKAHLKVSKLWSEFVDLLDKKNIIMSPFCGDISCEDKIKADSAKDEETADGGPAMGAKSLCIPFEQPAEILSSDKCIHSDCNNKPKFYTLFGRSY